MATQDENKKSGHLPKEDNAQSAEGKAPSKAPGKAKPSAANEAREQREIRREARDVEGDVRDAEITEESAKESVYGRSAVEQERRAELNQKEESRHLPEGQEASKPAPAAAPAAPAAPVEATTTVGAAAAQRTHTVASGDTLSQIAKNYYGDASQWRKIYEANQDKISNPDLIYPGQVFLIP
ncbi:MAG: LysM peptidoglycan-binding domain-containing protein [Ardenticatenales bacterium]|nr:LysM peptidoglycan-binding domain-containing protein [Ardenticatenales bacterium]